MSWINSCTDFSVCNVEHEIDKWKKSKIEKSSEMVLLCVTWYDDDLEVAIEDKVCFVFEDALQRFFVWIKLWELAEENAF